MSKEYLLQELRQITVENGGDPDDGYLDQEVIDDMSVEDLEEFIVTLRQIQAMEDI